MYPTFEGKKIILNFFADSTGLRKGKITYLGIPGAQKK